MAKAREDLFLLFLQAVQMRGYAQREPLVEYKLEGYNLFIEMMACIRPQHHLQLLHVQTSSGDLISALAAVHLSVAASGSLQTPVIF